MRSNNINEKKDKNKNFNKEITQICKGIAIILMIIHHLFWNVGGYGYKINNIALSQRIGIIGKVCVSIFLILSGYGIFQNLKKNYNMKFFYIKRISKLYLNYLLIVIVSTIIGIIFFPKCFFKLIPLNFRGLYKYCLTLSGLQYLVGYNGFNSSWWFVTCIIICYIFTPLIKKYIDKYKFKFMIIMFFISFIDFIPMKNLQIFNIISWIFPYSIGAYLSYNNNILKIKEYVNNRSKKVILLFLLFILLYIRQIGLYNNVYMCKIDYFLAFFIINSIYIFYDNIKLTKKYFIFLGKKSSDIYYIHMFISNYFLKDFTYNLKIPIIMFIFVLTISLVFSYILDIIRNVIQFDNIVKKVQNKLILN